MEKSESAYIDFASKVSFFEFIQEEFRSANLPTKELAREISLLAAKKQWNISELSDYIRQYPRSFLIFQQICQLLRFTNAQLIHFVFDVAKLNSPNPEAIFEYMILNLKYDPEFRKTFLGTLGPSREYEDFISNIHQHDRKFLIAVFKTAVSKYIQKIVGNFRILEARMLKSEFQDFSIRFANYLLQNLKLNETLATINLPEFLASKKVPIDTKSIHGRYAKLRILQVLEGSGYANIDKSLDGKSVRVLGYDLRKQVGDVFSGKNLFCTERYVEGIVKPKDNKMKKFDFVIFSDYKPKYLFEVNFYSTEGTKIGINQNEYIDLQKFIRENAGQFEFYWITDGNYWLTSQGKARFINLLKHFATILNINSFAESLSKFC